MATVHTPGPLETVVAWLDAMRRGDIPEVERWLDPEVIWRGVRNDAVCRNRDQVLDMLRGSLEGGFGAEAMELIPGDRGVVLGAKLRGLGEIGGVEVRDQLYNVFQVGCGQIVAVADYAYRDEALIAADAKAPEWASTAPADKVVDVVPFLKVTDVERAISFYAALGFEVVKRHEPRGQLEFAGLRASRAAKLMLARVDEPPESGPEARALGFLYLYTRDIEALRTRLTDLGHQPEEIERGHGPGPNRQMCVRDPDGHAHMVAELFEGSIATLDLAGD
jgi:catechol 2,3-dioxygenase-like lactoylglutathione lyase family enzyme/limonene-1,2-epoxide hydrolase